LGADRRTAAAQAVPPVLEGCRWRFIHLFTAIPKIFRKIKEIFEKSICICEKKGYNILE
jgi:hypothetical protein